MYLNNCWYVAALATEIDTTNTFVRTLLDQPVVFWRDGADRIVALGDRCPHRFAPLHKGKRNGNRISCPYHGLTFNEHGACVLSPHGDGSIPPLARVNAFPVIERNGFVWIWMGEPAKADAASIPDYSFMDTSPETAVNYGYLHSEAHYELMVDNILDLSHIDFLHPTLLATGGNVASQRPKVADEGEAIRSSWEWSGGAPMALFRSALPDVTDADGWLWVVWEPAGNMHLNTGATPVGRPRTEGASLTGIHCMTPETATTTHYFTASSRTFMTDDAAFNEAFTAAALTVFGHEDKPIIEFAQRYMGTTDLWSLNPAILSSDMGAVRARRRLAKLIRGEAQQPDRPQPADQEPATAT